MTASQTKNSVVEYQILLNETIYDAFILRMAKKQNGREDLLYHERITWIR
jgi:hypothetical protein